MSLNSDFMREPHHFAGAHTLYPYADPVTNQAHMKQLALTDGTQFTEVRGDNKVAFCDIRRATEIRPLPSDMSPALSYSDDVDLWVLRVTYKRDSSSSIPCYFLPWRKDYMMRVKLKPSVHHARQEGTVTKRVVEPDLFVTAALQGCTVMISGEPTAPTVYHLNASSVRGAGGETFGGNDAEFLVAAKAKVDHMKQLHADARQQHLKEGTKVAGVRPAPAGFQVGGAHVTDYMIGAKPAENAAISRFYSNRAPKVSVEQYGTVFGIREAGNWKFYRQTRTRLYYKDRTLNQFIKVWVDPTCVRIWP